MENKVKFIAFRATPGQWERIEQLATATGQNPSEVLRSLIDAATLVTPIIVANYGQTGHRQAAHHGA